MKTLVLGASDNPARYAYLAAQSLKRHGHELVAVGRKAKKVENWEILEGMPDLDGVHTITLYLNPKNQEPYYDYILDLAPKRVIFNPGTENPELIEKLKAAGIEAEVACTLVMLSTAQY